MSGFAIKVKCVGCGATRQVTAAQGKEVPICLKCFSPMVAEKAQLDAERRHYDGELAKAAQSSRNMQGREIEREPFTADEVAEWDVDPETER